MADVERFRILSELQQQQQQPSQRLTPTCDVIKSHSPIAVVGCGAVRCVTSLPALFDCGQYYVTGDDDVMMLSARCADRLETPDYVIKVEMRDSQLLPVWNSSTEQQNGSNNSGDDRSVANRKWTNCMRTARDRCEQNVRLVLDRTSSLASGRRACNLRLSTTRTVLAGEELLVWYGDELALELGVPTISPANISSDGNRQPQYVCTRCSKNFRFPNSLKSHLVHDCAIRRKTTSGVFSRQHQQEMFAPVNRYLPSTQLPGIPVGRQVVHWDHNDVIKNKTISAEPMSFERMFDFIGCNTGSSYVTGACATGNQIYWRPMDVVANLAVPMRPDYLPPVWLAWSNNFLSTHTGNGNAVAHSAFHSAPFGDLPQQFLDSISCRLAVQPEPEMAAKLLPVDERRRTRMTSAASSPPPSSSPMSSADDYDVITSARQLIPAQSDFSSSDRRRHHHLDASDRRSLVEARTPDTTDSRTADVEDCDERSSPAERSTKHEGGRSPRQQTAVMHRCVHCGKLYSRRYGLTIHLRTHTGLKPLQCPVCRRPFGDPSNLNKHVRLHADGDSPYRCRHCGKVLVRRRDLERHVRSRHPGELLPVVAMGSGPVVMATT